MGEFDEGTVPEPAAEQPAVDTPVADVPAADAPAPVAPAPAAAEPVAADIVADSDLTTLLPAVAPPAAEESGAELVARLAAEMTAEPPHTDEVSDDTDIAAIQQQLSLEVPEVVGAAGAGAAVAGATDATTSFDDVPVSTGAASDADDLEAALAAADEQVGVEPTLDDIEPGTKQTFDVEEEGFGETTPRYGAPWWPFIVYFVAWLAFAGFGAWQLTQLPASQVAYESQTYTLFVFGGLVMAAVGPILVLAVWLGARFSSRHHRTGLFSSAFIKGAVVTLIGVVLWLGTFMAVDFLRLGRTF